MELSAMMGKQVAQLQHTVNLSLMKTAMSQQAAGAIAMLEHVPQAPHPTKGHQVDMKA